MQKCTSCLKIKTTANTHTPCEVCGNWRPMTEKELEKVSKRAPKAKEAPAKKAPKKKAPKKKAS